MVELVVDGKQIEAEEGRRLLDVCLENGIYIPNLCYLEEMENPSASCRLCFVEIEGEEKPVSSCKVVVQPGMVVKTDTETVRQMQRSVFELLISNHHVNCKNCPSKKKCQLAKIGKLVGVKLKPVKLEQLDRDMSIEKEHPFWKFVPERCILCEKCVFVCQKHGHGCLGMVRRGMDRVVVAATAKNCEIVACSECKSCMNVCPVGAIVAKEEPAPEKMAG